MPKMRPSGDEISRHPDQVCRLRQYSLLRMLEMWLHIFCQQLIKKDNKQKLTRFNVALLSIIFVNSQIN